jgi:hypothetical protein
MRVLAAVLAALAIPVWAGHAFLALVFLDSCEGVCDGALELHPEDTIGYLAGSILLVALACVFWFCVAVGRARGAGQTFLIQLVVALAYVCFLLSENVGGLAAAFLAAETVAFLALLASRTEDRQRRMRPVG